MRTRFYSNREPLWALTIVFLIWALHCVALAYAFPVSEVWSANPLIYIDSPYHLYQMYTAEALWTHGSLIGYDPWFSAGYVGGVNYNASAKVPALVASLLHLQTPQALGIAYKAYVFFSGLIAPGFVLLATRLLKLDAISTVAATLIGVLLWWISALHWYETAGMVSFVLVSYASLPYAALVWRAVTGGLTSAIVLALSLWGILGLLFHPLFPIPVIFAASSLVLADWKQVRLKALLVVLFVVPVLCLLPSLVWMLPTIHFTGLSDGSLAPFQKKVDIAIVYNEAMGRIVGAARGARLNPAIWLCAIWACLPLTGARERRIAVGYTIAGLALAVFAAIGAAVPMFATLQPNRQSAAAYLLLVIPTGIGISSMIGSIRHQNGTVRYASRGAGMLLVVASIFFTKEFGNEISGTNTPHYGRPSPEVRPVGDLTLWLTDWIKHNTTTDARILFETSPGRIYDGAHISGYLALDCKREFIGGPYVYIHPDSSFWDGHVFGKPIGNFSAASFLDRLGQYNVGWIVVHSKESMEFLDKLPYVRKLAKHGPVTIYTVSIKPSYFIEGDGRVTSRHFDRIDLDNVTGQSIVLKYHYVNGLATSPPLNLEPVLLPGDAVPFIRVLHPPQRLSIIYQ